MVREILLSWLPPSLSTCIELMSLRAPFTCADIDMMWATAFGRVLPDMAEDSLCLYMPCILGYFGYISTIQQFYPSATATVQSAPRCDSGGGHERGAVDLLAEFLIDRASQSFAVANLLFWRLKVASKEISEGGGGGEPSSLAGGGAGDASGGAAPGGQRDNVFARLTGLLLLRLQKKVRLPPGQGPA